MKTPSKIQLHKHSKTLELHYGRDTYELSCEFLRVHSPSAEVKGHGPGQEVLQHGKIDVAITAINPAGNYALQFTFDDGHDSGIYSWDYLFSLCQNKEQLWEEYLQKLHDEGKTRDANISVVKLMEP